MRNRYRRERLARRLREEITPKNILMIGPTGVGKTEIARRLATLAGAPFVKVEATKYTEVGYVGRDVESMVRDLAEAAIRMVTDERRAEVREPADAPRSSASSTCCIPETRAPQPQQANPFAATLGSIFGNAFAQTQPQQAATQTATRTLPADEAARVRASAKADVERGFYDVRADRDRSRGSGAAADRHDRRRRAGGMGGGDIGEMLGGLLPKKRDAESASPSPTRAASSRRKKPTS